MRLLMFSISFSEVLTMRTFYVATVSISVKETWWSHTREIHYNQMEKKIIPSLMYHGAHSAFPVQLPEGHA